MNGMYLDFAKEIALKAKEIMLKYYNNDNGSSYKIDNTIVTKADTEINEYLIKKVKEVFPTHSVDGEEEQFGSSEYIWVCDPVDGTAMYARHIPTSVFSLALVINGDPVVGVIMDPFNDDLYCAQIGLGAYKNDIKIKVNDIEFNDMRSVSHFDMFPTFEYNIFDAVEELAKKTYFISIGSVARACACVASGEVNVAIFPGTKRKNCDVAAAKVIVEEAGGVVTDLFGNNQKYNTDINGVIVSNGKVHHEVLNALRTHMKSM